MARIGRPRTLTAAQTREAAALVHGGMPITAAEERVGISPGRLRLLGARFGVAHPPPVSPRAGRRFARVPEAAEC